MKKFKKEVCPKDYQEIEIKLKSGSVCTCYYNSNYSDIYEELYKRTLTHIEFYGETVSETGFRSWFGCLEKYDDISKGVVAVAQFLEDEVIKENPQVLFQIEQQTLF